MDLVALFWSLVYSLKYIVPFLVALTPLVFFHELGHFWVARRNGVRVDVFSIGFGAELFGWNDRHGTRWKISALPLGGYVRMFGDADEASTPGANVEGMSAADREVSFHHKGVWQRIAIVAAGPIANFILAIVIFAGLFAFVGQPYTTPVINQVEPDSAADRAGIKTGDIVIRIDGQAVDRFETMQQIIQLNLDRTLEFVVLRDGKEVALSATPTIREETDWTGNKIRVPRLGVRGTTSNYVRHGPVMAIWHGVEETYTQSVGMLRAVGQMIMGRRTTDELGGPLRIAQMSGDVAAQLDVASFLVFIAMLSISLGVLNLFPIPMLDGGHLLFYGVEALRGRPLAMRTQEYGFRIGLMLILGLMVFTTWNDLVRFRVVAYLVGLFS